MIPTDRLRDLVAESLPSIVELRREIHRHPEVAFAEHQTTDLVYQHLANAGVESTLRHPKTGLVAELGTGRDATGFRADLDALPIQERTGAAYASLVPGVMHACGHDVHAAIGVGIGTVLSQIESDLPGRIRLIFQPAEESFPSGAVDMIRDGVHHGLKSIFAFHVDPTLEAGRLGYREGPITASADRLTITLEGPGGHTARPHKTVDLIGAAGKLLAELPDLLRGRIDSRKPLVVVFGRVSGGTADNVIPSSVEMSATARTLDRGVWDALPEMVDSAVRDICASTGAKTTVNYRRGIPPVVNNGAVIDTVRLATDEALGVESSHDTHTSMGGEDFSRYLDDVPGALVRLGAKPAGDPVDLHSTRFDIDEASISTGVLAGCIAMVALLES